MHLRSRTPRIYHGRFSHALDESAGDDAQVLAARCFDAREARSVDSVSDYALTASDLAVRTLFSISREESSGIEI